MGDVYGISTYERSVKWEKRTHETSHNISEEVFEEDGIAFECILSISSPSTHPPRQMLHPREILHQIRSRDRRLQRPLREMIHPQDDGVPAVFHGRQPVDHG